MNFYVVETVETAPSERLLECEVASKLIISWALELLAGVEHLHVSEASLTNSNRTTDRHGFCGSGL